MPETLAPTLEQRVAALVGARRAELEQLVDRELDRAIGALVVERIAARNGGASELRTQSATPAPSCSHCGERPRATNRTVCTRCLERGKRERRAERARAVAEEPAVPFAGSASEHSPAGTPAPSSAPSSTTS